jgi:hypothetical protein
VDGLNRAGFGGGRVWRGGVDGGEAVSAWRSCNVRSLPATVSAREGPAAAVQRQAGSVSLISRIGTGGSLFKHVNPDRIDH